MNEKGGQAGSTAAEKVSVWSRSCCYHSPAPHAGHIVSIQSHVSMPWTAAQLLSRHRHTASSSAAAVLNVTASTPHRAAAPWQAL